jgi:DNA-binding MarR family transcriptional regulator
MRRGSPLRGMRPPAETDGQLALSVWLRLLKAHGLILRELRRRIPDGLTLPQFDVLAQLDRGEQGMTPGELTRELLVTAGNVTGIVDRLVRLALVERRPVPEDRRAVRVRLTSRGRQLMRRAIPRHRQDVESLLSRVPPADLTRLRDLLGRLAHALEERP